MTNLPIYIPGQILNENEYLLKVRPRNKYSICDTGFFSKLTQKNVIPKPFDDWNYNEHYDKTKLPIYVYTEEFKSGWKLFSWRFGKSQNWAIIIHPEGFTLEIYLNQFLDVIKDCTIINGEIIGEFKWEENRLIKK